MHTMNRRQMMAHSAGLLASLGLVAEASAQSANDYKALVCIFLFGANDHYNTLLPYDATSHGDYFKIRKGPAVAGTPYEGIALPRSLLTATALNPLKDGRQMALNPQMPEIKTLFDAGRAAWLMNVGPLVEPTTRLQYDNKSVRLPPKLFSHNDQQAYWQSSFQTEGAATGWGGRAADLWLSGNGKANLTCISVNGNALLLSGNQALSYQISATGPTTVNALKSASLFGSANAANVLKSLLTQNPSGVMAGEYNKVTRRALDTYDTLATAVGSTASTAINSWFASSATNTLSAQLKMVARLIEKQSLLGVRRQVFMVGMGGFDLHDDLPSLHPPLLQKVSQACKEFDDAMVGLGVSNQVTAFTASDFGRTLASNGDGSDHGWGSHHLIMGGAVKGGNFYGTAPQISVSNNEQVGSGRLLPTTSLEQMGAELARWMGVTDPHDMKLVFPKAENFDLYKLGMI
jgi:uncharacterized protein (DUF1501 family)